MKKFAQNRKARHNYEILQTIECGISLLGSEVKSVRNSKVSLDSSYASIVKNELWLIECTIEHYKNSSFDLHSTKRPKKLLVKKIELKKIKDEVKNPGFTLIPLELIEVKGLIKIVLAICKGKQKQDKRQSEKEKEIKKYIKKFS